MKGIIGFVQPCLLLLPRANQYLSPITTHYHKKLLSITPCKRKLVGVSNPWRYPLRASDDSLSTLWTALKRGTVFFDFPQFSFFRVTGNDRLLFLHNMSSNHFLGLRPFQVQWTCFLTSTGRLLDVALVLVLPDSILIIGSIEKKQILWQHFDKHIFPMDDVKVVEEDYTSFIWIGNQASDWVLQWCHQMSHSWDQDAVKVFHDSTRSMYLLAQSTMEPQWPGYLLLCSPQDTSVVQKSIDKFQHDGFLVFHMYQQHWECLRLILGKGNQTREWSERYHPLEAGLWHMVSFQKGCYLGQETILRLKTYGGVKRHLVGWYLQQPVEPFCPVYYQQQRVGVVTSCHTIKNNQQDNVVIGLGYLLRDYTTLQYATTELPFEIIPSHLPWDSTLFFSPQSSTRVVRCILRNISFPVYDTTDRIG